MAQKIRLKKSNVVDKTPVASSVDFGEVSVNYASGLGKSFLTTKKYDGTMAKFHEDSYNEDKFATKDSVTVIQSSLSNFALSATVKSQISGLSVTIEDDEYVIAQAFNDQNDRISALEGITSGLDGEFLTLESATSVFNDFSSQITGLQTFTGTVANTYATKELVGTVSGNVWTSAKTYTDKRIAATSGALLTNDAFANYSSSTDSTIQTLSDNLTGFSANVINNYATKAVASGYAVSALGDANDYTDSKISGLSIGNYVTHEYFGEYSGGVSSSLNTLDKRVGYVSGAVSSLTNNVTTNYATKELVGNTSAKTVAVASWSAISHTVSNDTFASYSGTVSSDMNILGKSAMTVSANVIALSANVVSRISSVYRYKGTKDTASQLPTTNNEEGDVWNVVAASGNTPAGTNYAWVKDSASTGHWDALGGTIDLSGFFTSASAAELKSSLEAADQALQNKIDAVSGTANSRFAVSSVTQAVIDAAVVKAINSAYTKSSGYTKNITDAISGTVNNYKSTNDAFVTSVKTGLSAWTVQSAATHAEVASASATAVSNAVSTAKTYTDTSVNTASGKLVTNAWMATYSSTTSNEINTVKTSLTAFSATVMSDYATETEASSYAAAALGNAMAYTDSKISGLSIGDYVTHTQFGSYSSTTNSEINNIKNNYALSATVKTAIDNINDTIEENEEVTSAAINDLNNRIKNVSGLTSGYILSSTVVSLQSTLESGINNAAKKADYVSGVVSAFSSSVVTNYATKDFVTGTSARTCASAVAYADRTFLTITSATDKFSVIDQAINSLQSASGNYVTITGSQTVSGIKTFSNGFKLTTASTVTATSYRAIPYTMDGDNSRVMYTNPNVNSGLTYNPKYGWLRAGGFVITGKTANDLLNAAGGTTSRWDFASSGAVSTIDSTVTSLKNNLSAWTVQNAATHSEVNTASGTAASNAYSSAKTYTDSRINATSGQLVTNSWMGTYSSTTENKITTVTNNVNTLSASVINDYATKANASSYAAAALSNAIDYVDSKIAEGDYVTTATYTAYTGTVNSTLTAHTNSINIVSGAVSALSASVVTNYATKTNLRDTSAATVAVATNSAVNYTIASAVSNTKFATYSATVNSTINTVSGNMVSLSANVATKLSTVFTYKGSVASCAALPATANTGDTWNVVAASGNTPAGTNWTWNGTAWDPLAGTVDLSAYLTVASATNAFSTLESRLGDYALSATVDSSIEEIYDTISENEEVTAEALNDLNTRLNNSEQLVSTFSSRFYPTASATSKFSTIESNINTLNTLANSAYTYADTINNNLGTYATDTDVANASGAAVAVATNSALTYVSNNYTDTGTTETMQSTINSLTAATGNFVTLKTVQTINSAKTFTAPIIMNVGANGYSDSYSSSGINMNNSNIVALNSIYTADSSDGPAEGFHFYRDATHVDTFRATGGVLKFFPNRTVGSTAGTEYNVYHTGNLSPVTTNSVQTIESAKTFTKTIVFNAGLTVQSAASFSNVFRAVPFSDPNFPYTTIRYINTNANSGLTYNPFTGKLKAGGYTIEGKAGTDLLNATGGTTTVSSIVGSYVPTTRKVNGHALSGDVTVSKADVGLGNVDNIAQSAWTGNTKIASVGTITAGTWNGTKIANAYLANNAVAIDGQVVALGTSASTKYVRQSHSTTTSYRPLLVGYTSSGSAVGLSADVTNQVYVTTKAYMKPSDGTIHAGGYIIDGKAATDLLNATGGVTTVASIRSGYVPETRKVNGKALSGDVTISKTDLSLNNVENTALSTWTGNTSIKSVGTITAGTWNGTKIANQYLANSAITINGTAVGLGGSITVSTTDKNVGQASSTAAERRALILGTTTAATGTALGTTAVTGETAFNKDIYAIPSTGQLNAKQMRVDEHVTLQYNSTTQALDFIFS